MRGHRSDAPQPEHRTSQRGFLADLGDLADKSEDGGESPMDLPFDYEAERVRARLYVGTYDPIEAAKAKAEAVPPPANLREIIQSYAQPTGREARA